MSTHGSLKQLTHYLKFGLFHLLTLLTIVSLILGHMWILAGFALVSSIIVLGDACLGSDVSTPELGSAKALNCLLFAALPLLVTMMFAGLWSVSESDLMGFGHWLSGWVDYDFLAAKQQTQLWHHVVAVFFIGLMVSTVATVTGHELVHRTWDRASLIVGRWLLAFSFDANFSIEHVYGHHRHVATEKDPATAPRGRNVYQHILISTVKGNISAWNIEKQRLIRLKRNPLSWQNPCIRGYMMSLFLLTGAYFLAGVAGLIFFLAAGLWAKCMLEIVNYIEHYGLVRAPNKRVEPRHSWNTNAKISSWALFNLSRHSHHHAHSQLPFYKLNPYPNAPKMFSGYLASVIVALIPPLWFHLMKPRLAHWDEYYATDEERKIIP